MARFGQSRRLAREARTMEAMLVMYCRAHHVATAVPCDVCQELLAYAKRRLAGCRFQDNKPTCARCPVHCYRRAMRERIRNVMRFAGPRMLARHPILALFHLLDGRRPVAHATAHGDGGGDAGRQGAPALPDGGVDSKGSCGEAT